MKFSYKTKQPVPPPPGFVKVVEIIQKNHIFQCFWKIPKKIVYSRVRKGAGLCFESWHLCKLNHVSYGINSKSTRMQRYIMPKNDNSNAKMYVYYYCSTFINKFEQITWPLLMFILWSLSRYVFAGENLMFDHWSYLILLYLFIMIA